MRRLKGSKTIYEAWMRDVWMDEEKNLKVAWVLDDECRESQGRREKNPSSK